MLSLGRGRRLLRQPRSVAFEILTFYDEQPSVGAHPSLGIRIVAFVCKLSRLDAVFIIDRKFRTMNHEVALLVGSCAMSHVLDAVRPVNKFQAATGEKEAVFTTMTRRQLLV
jgi:hypothetical protein